MYRWPSRTVSISMRFPAKTRWSARSPVWRRAMQPTWRVHGRQQGEAEEVQARSRKPLPVAARVSASRRARGAAAAQAHVGLDSDLPVYFKDPRVRRAFSFQAKYLGMSPFNCPSLLPSSASRARVRRVAPDRGCNAVMQKMGELAARMASTFTSRRRRGGGVRRQARQGRSHRQGNYPADAVVMNADFAESMKKLWSGKRAPSLERSEDRYAAVLVLDVHALPGHPRTDAQSPSAPHDPAVRRLHRQHRRDPEGTRCCRPIPRCTSRTPAAPIPRWRRKATPPCTSSCPCRTSPTASTGRRRRPPSASASLSGSLSWV